MALYSELPVYKRSYDLLMEIVSLSKILRKEMNQLTIDLFKAYFIARRNKRNTFNQLKFEFRFEKNLLELSEEILERKYKPRPEIAFIINKPVKREIFAADFRDRIVHHLLFGYLNPIVEKYLIHDCYSSRKGKGTHYGIMRINSFVRACSSNYKNAAYILKLDIKGYFMSICRPLLYNKIKAIIQKEKTKNKLLAFDEDVFW
ncbi:MAG: hypothetical protein K0B08_04260 [Bacteroidales bacterium]|nr:hypothetical protein [Bacteroidales bacterium]